MRYFRLKWAGAPKRRWIRKRDNAGYLVEELTSAGHPLVFVDAGLHACTEEPISQRQYHRLHYRYRKRYKLSLHREHVKLCSGFALAYGVSRMVGHSSAIHITT